MTPSKQAGNESPSSVPSNLPDRKNLAKRYESLALFMGDQLNRGHSWFEKVDSSRLFVIAELRQETDYCRHHVQKLCAFFTAMACFAEELREAGHDVLYLNLDETEHFKTLDALLAALIEKYSVSQFQYQRPDEWRVARQLEQLDLAEGIKVERAETEHFLLPFEEIEKQFKKGKHQRMESFYRRMRRQHGYLMDGDQPRGDKWNFDQANRKKLKKTDLEEIPDPLIFANDVGEILKRIDRHQVAHFGSAKEQLPWPVNRGQALELLEWFCQHCLPRFGMFQDAMTRQIESRWSLYHSRLSFAINAKILSPAEVIERAIEAQSARPEEIDLAQTEGFVRQLLGWREYIRAVYWVNAPDYGQLNHFSAERDLPEYFWTGKTGMRCVSEAVGQSLEHAYAHHIQRLMVTGNFALLTELDPDQVDRWYLGIYIDALEWVEQPNTRGMALFADGGIVGTKPYAASGNYINKMSDYCGGCQYDVKLRSGPKSCPFNSFYWRFMNQHREQLSRNHRLGMLFGSWDKLAADEREAILETARRNLIRIDSL